MLKCAEHCGRYPDYVTRGFYGPLDSTTYKILSLVSRVLLHKRYRSIAIECSTPLQLLFLIPPAVDSGDR